MKNLGSFALGAMTVLGIWMLTANKCTMNQVVQTISDAATQISSAFKGDKQKCDSNCTSESKSA